MADKMRYGKKTSNTGNKSYKTWQPYKLQIVGRIANAADHWQYTAWSICGGICLISVPNSCSILYLKDGTFW